MLTIPLTFAATLGKGPQKPPKPHSFQKKPAKTELEGNKWNIVRSFLRQRAMHNRSLTPLFDFNQENHENNEMILIEQTEINHIVNVFNVKSSVIQIKGKVNAISLGNCSPARLPIPPLDLSSPTVNCTKVSLLLDSTVSSLAISSSPSFTVQILGKVPTILIDGTDGGQVYLSRESLDVEIITAKTSAINVSLPGEGEEDGIFEERAVPEQLKTVVKDGKLVTSVVEHSG